MPKRKRDSPVYPELEAQIAKQGIRKKDIADTLGIEARTFSAKIGGQRDFSLQEALTIWETYFSAIPVQELFKKNGETL